MIDLTFDEICTLDAEYGASTSGVHRRTAIFKERVIRLG